MKYPFHTQSKPVVGHEAQRLISAIEHDNYVTNDAAMATVHRIAKRRKASKGQGSNILSVGDVSPRELTDLDAAISCTEFSAPQR